MYIFRFALCLLLLATSSAFADIPYLSNSRLDSTTTPYPGTGGFYIGGEVDVVMMSGSDAPGNFTNCADTSSAPYAFGAVIYANGYQSQIPDDTGMIRVKCGDSWASMVNKWKQQYGSSAHVTLVPQYINAQYVSPTMPSSTLTYTICMGVSNLEGWSTMSLRLPLSNCLATPAPPVWCNSLPDITLNHQAIALHAVSEVSQQTVLTCSGAAGITLSLTRSIELDPSITNTLKVNGVELSTTPQHFQLTQNTTPMTFVSTITDSSKGGQFSASAVLIMSVE